jgi:hypothetical protein
VAYQQSQEVRLGPVADAVASVAALFLMGLFLLVSGLLAAGSIERKGTARFARDRLLRLGVPFVVWVLGVWPLTLVALYRVVGHDTDYARMLVDSRLDTGPMWFVEILLLLSLGYAAWRRVAGRPAAERPAPVEGASTDSPRTNAASARSGRPRRARTEQLHPVERGPAGDAGAPGQPDDRLRRDGLARPRLPHAPRSTNLVTPACPRAPRTSPAPETAKHERPRGTAVGFDSI